ncbi:hypothetical protein [Blastococcus sp. CCUG 61487]|uniref:hypothetical protein n=1 Tax=Blastococcus sp. CCUG 61487 TaxID=1840703 RepID=UPI001135185E|nr:hypothetical protein [Blastococcus sp. CCUG 61487]TKJ18868.1 hypothetical protein A6V29_10810 [Blastococcus sp. CCUG 61487]
MLVVDLDRDPLAPPRALEEILLRRGTWEDDDRRELGTGAQPLRLPAPLAPPRTELISLLARKVGPSRFKG